ncbi:glycosyltransferase [Rhodobacter sp. Har01]|uniref:glycosyltransferase n=1 Tax=Rhodobacter sp. Har01 TaxID=2883999 RepID=UPI001D0692D7|nr:glycosyltransferase family 2 protein [Rhodobacter sp. Har01]MCB6180103.1 glycosyltransferase [Rhodobacter sp. Har01]
MPMTDTPALSVIIPHLNAPEVLTRCLDALAAQRGDGVSFEVIVADNGSAVPPEAVVAGFPFARLVVEPTPGPGPARNHGARIARAPILAFIDCDCIAAPGWIAAIAGHFAAHPETGVIGGDVRIECADPGRPTAIEAYESIYGYRFKLYIERDHYAGAGNMAVRRALFQQVGDFGGIDIAEDMDWGRRATAMGVRTTYVPRMQISTPARDSFAQLTRKWDRHIGHDFAAVKSLPDRLRWALRALSLGLSPMVETGRILTSDRVSGLRERWLAFRCLTRIRLYRCRRMLGLVAGGDGAALAKGWRGNG